MKEEGRIRKSAQSTGVSFALVGFGLQPDEVTRALGIEPTTAEISQVKRCGTSLKHDCGLWCYDTAKNFPGAEEDVGAHLEYLLSLFRPLRGRIEGIRPRPNAFVHLRCKPVGLAPLLLVPQIDARHVAGIAELGAALKVQIWV